MLTHVNALGERGGNPERVDVQIPKNGQRRRNNCRRPWDQVLPGFLRLHFYNIIFDIEGVGDCVTWRKPKEEMITVIFDCYFYPQSPENDTKEIG